MAKDHKAAAKNKAKAKKWKKRAKKLSAKLAKFGAVPTAVASATGDSPAPAKSKPPVSPLAPKGGFPALPPIAGVRFATAQAGVRYQGRRDVMLATLAPGSVIAGTFTRSATRSAAVLDCQDKIAGKTGTDQGAAILVNSGNSNAFTGAKGRASVAALTQSVAETLSLPVERVFTSSTGVIGEPLPHERIQAVLGDLAGALSPDGITDAARAIMTTDTYPKGSMAQIDIDGAPVTICGIAKGSGMIAPDMATMLVYIFTDAAITQRPLQTMVSRLTDESFNSITVDSDTSTSDTLLVAATGQSAAPAITSLRSKPARAFEQALRGVMMDLAHQVIRDGEGATKFVQISVTGAETDTDAKRCALSIANSPLVKTALAGNDPNWGRIVAAVGKSGAAADRDTLSIRFGGIPVATNGMVDPDYAEADGAAHFKGDEIDIGVDLGLGQGKATVWTCDLTHGYIQINADYRS